MFKIVSTLRCFVWTRKVTSSCGSSSHANCCRWSWWFQPQTRAPPKDKQETYIETSKAFSKIPGIYRHWYPKLHRNVSFPFILPFLCLLRLTFACKLLNISFHPWKPIHFGRGISLPSSLFATNPCTSNQPTFIQIPSTSPGHGDVVCTCRGQTRGTGHDSQTSKKKSTGIHHPNKAEQGQQN